ncbi:MAG: sensor histidine kinase [archaeon]|nr:sensor histidine kinase [archaeon]
MNAEPEYLPYPYPLSFKLYNQSSFDCIDISEYIEPLAIDIIKIFPDRNKVKLNLDIANFEVDSNIVLKLGIILNELLTNSMKYAFENRSDGEITISIKKDMSQVSFIYEDNGKNFNVDEVMKSKGFGHTLISLLVNQINGSYTIESSKSCIYKISFNINK